MPKGASPLSIIGVAFFFGHAMPNNRLWSWHVDSLPPSQSALMSVTALPTNEILAVGGSPNSGLIATRTNESWQLSPLGDQMLHWIHAGTSKVWVVGRKGRVYSRGVQTDEWMGSD